MTSGLIRCTVWETGGHPSPHCTRTATANRGEKSVKKRTSFKRVNGRGPKPKGFRRVLLYAPVQTHLTHRVHLWTDLWFRKLGGPAHKCEGTHPLPHVHSLPLEEGTHHERALTIPMIPQWFPHERKSYQKYNLKGIVGTMAINVSTLCRREGAQTAWPSTRGKEMWWFDIKASTAWDHTIQSNIR